MANSLNHVKGLNAPFGARCFLTTVLWSFSGTRRCCLNAPFGARCFLTQAISASATRSSMTRLNAPFGARCFLTIESGLGGAFKSAAS